jgi:hypothetical protein
MIGPPQISKNLLRGKPFLKGKPGNPGGRPKRTPNFKNPNANMIAKSFTLSSWQHNGR